MTEVCPFILVITFLFSPQLCRLKTDLNFFNRISFFTKSVIVSNHNNKTISQILNIFMRSLRAQSLNNYGYLSFSVPKKKK